MERTQNQIIRRSGLLPAAGLAVALALSGCGSGAPEAGPAPVSRPPSSSPAPSASPSATAATVIPSAETKTFAFTTQKLSLRYPAAWTAESRTSPRGPVMGEFVTFKDAKGRTLFTVASGFSSYDYGWPVRRTVIESGPVPGLSPAGWTPAYQFAFYAEEPLSGPGPGTVCTLALVREVPPDGPGMLRGQPTGEPTAVPSSWTGPFLGVELSQDIEKCGDVAAAKAWWASREGQQFKAVVLSLKAS